jgi:hypothetical protein
MISAPAYQIVESVAFYILIARLLWYEFSALVKRVTALEERETKKPCNSPGLCPTALAMSRDDHSMP